MQDLITFLTNHEMLSLAAAALVALAMGVELIRARRNVFSLSPTEVTQKINHENAVLIDIRSEELYRKGHIIDAVSMAANDISNNPKKIEKYRGKPIVVVCNSGLEGQKVAALLLKQGYNAYSLAGGIRSWIAAQLPLVN